MLHNRTGGLHQVLVGLVRQQTRAHGAILEVVFESAGQWIRRTADETRSRRLQ